MTAKRFTRSKNLLFRFWVFMVPETIYLFTPDMTTLVSRIRPGRFEVVARLITSRVNDV